MLAPSISWCDKCSLRAGYRHPTDSPQRPADAHVAVKEWHLDIDPRELRWESYVKAGYYGVLERFFADPAAGCVSCVCCMYAR